MVAGGEDGGMISLNFHADVRKATATLSEAAAKQVPFATAKALTTLAKLAQADIQQALPSIFGHLAPFTRQGIAIKAATKASLTAQVYVKPLQAQYLGLEEFGGTRTPAMNTRIVSRALTMPGVNARLNDAGSLPRGYVAKLAAMAEADAGPRKGQTVVKFSGSGPNGKGPGGFFLRLPGHHIRRLISFEASAQYKPKFGFEKRVEAKVRADFAGVFGAAMTQAVATANA